MTDPIISQPIQIINNIEIESDVAGATSVTPSYIPSEVNAVSQVEPEVGIDGVSISTSVSASSSPELSAAAVPVQEEGYIKNDLEPLPSLATVIQEQNDELDVNTLGEIYDAYKYISPQDPEITQIINELYSNGTLNDTMSDQEKMEAIHTYVTRNYSYIAENAGVDDWLSVSQTIKFGGGDCEDLANLEASLFIAVLIKSGMSLQDAILKVNVNVVADLSTGIGHVYVSYLGDDGAMINFDPSMKGSTSFKLPLNSYAILFKYNSTAVYQLDTSRDYINLITASYVIPTDTLSATNVATLGVLTAGEARLGAIQTDLFKFNSVMDVLTKQTTLDLKKAAYDGAVLAQQGAYATYTTESDNAWVHWHYSGGWTWWWDGSISPQWVDQNPGEYEYGDIGGATWAAISAYHAAVAATGVAWNNWQTALTNYQADAVAKGYLNSAQNAAVNNTYAYDYFWDPGFFFSWDIPISEAQYNILLAQGEDVSRTVNAYNTTVARSNLIDAYVDAYPITLTLTYDYSVGPVPVNINIGTLKQNLFVLSGGWYVLPDWSAATTDNPNFYLQQVFDPNTNIFTIYKVEIDRIRASMMIFSMIHEVLMDIRNFVNQELRGAEEGGYKGMEISKLFSKICKRVEDAWQNLIVSVMNIISLRNQIINQERQNAIQAERNAALQEIKDDAAGWNMFAGGNAGDNWWNAEENSLENEKLRVDQLQGVANEYEKANNANLAQMQNMLINLGSAAGVDTRSIVNGIAGAVQATTDTSDDGRYLELNLNTVQALGAQLSGIFQLGRMRLMMAETLAGMRNLVHQEMTGVSGRTLRSDVAGDMLESESKAAEGLFNQIVTTTDLSVQLRNQQTYYQINSDKLQDNIDQVSSFWSRATHYFSKAIGAITAIVGTILAFIPVVGWVVGAAVALAGQMSASIATAGRSLVNSYVMYLNEKRHNDVIKPTTFNYSRTDVLVGNTGDPVLDAIMNNEQRLQDTLDEMNWENLRSSNNDGSGGDAEENSANNWTTLGLSTLLGVGPIAGAMGFVAGSLAPEANQAYGASYSFDNARAAAYNDRLTALQATTAIMNSIRRTMYEMRNLVHMEMTSIGGRGSSNMLTYALEAARGQIALGERLATMSAQNQESSSRMQNQRNRNIAGLAQQIQNAANALALSFIPIVGSFASNLMDMYSQRRTYQNLTNAHFDPDNSHEFQNRVINELIRNGTIDAGAGYTAVDDAQFIAAKSAVTQQAIANTVLAAIQKAQHDMRTLTHLEMTGVSGRQGSDVVSEVNAMQFESVMKQIDLVQQAVTKKVTIMNQVKDAKDMVDKIDKQIANTWAMSGVSIGLQILSIVLSVVGLGGIVSALISITSSLLASLNALSNAQLDVDYFNTRTQNDTGGLIAMLNRIKNMSSPSSTESRMEQLEREMLEELSLSLISNTLFGTVGVNRGLGAKYKAAMEKLFKAERLKNQVQKAVNEVRNIVHEAVTGMSGIRVDSTSQALSMELQKALAKIDAAFSALSSIADRMNQITEAKREQATAKIALQSAKISMVITVVQNLIRFVKAFATSAQANANKEAKAAHETATKNVETAKDGVKTAEKGTPAEKAAAEAKLNKAEETATAKKEAATAAEKTATEATRPYDIAEMTLSYAHMIINLQMINIEKQQKLAAEAKIETDVAANSSSPGASTESDAINNAGLAEDGSMEDLTALLEEKLGATQLKSKSLQNKHRRDEINTEAQEKLNEWMQSTAKTAMETVRDNSKKPNEVVAPKETSSSPNTPKAREVKMEAAVKRLGELLTKKTPTDPQALQAHMAQMKEAANDVRVAAKEVTKANTTALLARADQIMAMKPAKTSSTSSTAGPEMPKEAEATEEKPSAEDIKKAIDSTKKELLATQKKLGEALAALKEAKNKLPEGEQAAISAQEKLLEVEKKKVDGLLKLQGDLGRMEKLLEGQTDDSLKNIVGAKKNELSSAIATLTSDLETIKMEQAGASMLIGVPQDKIKAAEAEVKGTKDKIGELQGRLKVLQKALVAVSKGDTKPAGPTAGGKVDARTPMTTTAR